MKKMPLSKKDVIPGSKIPVAFLFDYFIEGYSISDFIAAYPWIKKAAAKKVLEEIKRRETTSRYAI